MFDAIKGLLSDLMPSEGIQEVKPRIVDSKLASAVLMVQVIVADGQVKPEEEAKLREILIQNYAITEEEADLLAKQAKAAQDEAIDLYSFTSLLKRELGEDERLRLVEDLWIMVFADGELHEFEDNVVWRVAELLGIQSRNRMELKKRVLARNA